MPRGRGFFGRIRDTVRRIIAPTRPVQPPPREPPPIPPREPPPPPTGRTSPFRATFDSEVSRQTTRDVTRRTGYSRNEQYQLHYELFLSTYLTELPEDEQLEAWDGYLDSFVKNTRPHGEWFREWGMDPRDFDWQAWRAAMGYGNRKL